MLGPYRQSYQTRSLLSIVAMVAGALISIALGWYGLSHHPFSDAAMVAGIVMLVITLGIAALVILNLRWELVLDDHTLCWYVRHAPELNMQLPIERIQSVIVQMERKHSRIMVTTTDGQQHMVPGRCVQHPPTTLLTQLRERCPAIDICVNGHWR